MTFVHIFIKKSTPGPHPDLTQQKKGVPRLGLPCRRWAATYFPTNERSIIGDVRLNFSVRNGKRWTLTP